jgi:hypothetical protein
MVMGTSLAQVSIFNQMKSVRHHNNQVSSRIVSRAGLCPE